MGKVCAKMQAAQINSHLHEKAIKHPDYQFTGNEANDDRLKFQHFRDRIVWSSSFKRLARKTQVFPRYYSDNHRRRLTHSLEVMQLSTSIARTLKLNELLAEAIALAHDLGHTPFGHAGEDALNLAFEKIIKNNKDYYTKGMDHFTHYEQGLDVVSYIEPENATSSTKMGLGLCDEILEGILKHTYDHGAEKESNDNDSQKNLNHLLKNTKYRWFVDNHGSMEAQTVRVCDKISYFISDLEDGFRIGAIHIEDIEGLDLFKSELDNILKNTTQHKEMGDLQLFSLIRNDILSKIVSSVLNNSATNMDQKVNGNEIVICPDNTMQMEMDKVYNSIQKRILFKHFFVEQANNRAKQIVSCLFCQYLRHPELIPWSFRSRYIKSDLFKKKVQQLYTPENDQNSGDLRVDLVIFDWNKEIENSNIAFCGSRFGERIKNRKLIDIICAKDFIASMTDNYAEDRFAKDVCCEGSDRAWSEMKRERKVWS